MTFRGYARLGKCRSKDPSRSSELKEYFFVLDSTKGYLIYYEDDPDAWSKASVPALQTFEVCFMKKITTSVFVKTEELVLHFTYSGVSYMMAYNLKSTVQWCDEILKARNIRIKHQFKPNKCDEYLQYDSLYKTKPSSCSQLNPSSSVESDSVESAPQTPVTDSRKVSLKNLYSSLQYKHRPRACSNHSLCSQTLADRFEGEIIRISPVQKLSGRFGIWKSKFLVLTSKFLGYYSSKPRGDHFFSSQSLSVFKANTMLPLESLVSAFLAPSTRGKDQVRISSQCQSDILTVKFSSRAEAEVWCTHLNAVIHNIQNSSPNCSAWI